MLFSAGVAIIAVLMPILVAIGIAHLVGRAS